MYTFNLLQPGEIAANLTELGIRVDAGDISTPQTPVIRAVYQRLVMMLMYVTPKELTQPNFQALSTTIEYPDLHVQSIPEMAFYRHLGTLMRAVQVTDFCRADVETPDARKTVRNLSAIINFIKFREERLARFEELQNGIEELASIREEHMHEHSTVDSELTSRLEKLRSEEPLVQRLQAECTELDQSVKALKEQQESLHDENTELKERTAELLNEKSNLKFNIVGTKQELVRQRNQLIPDPDKLRKTLEEMDENVDGMKNEIRQLDGTLKELHARVERYAKVEKDTRKGLVYMQRCAEKINRANEAKAAVAEVETQVQARERELDEARLRNLELRRQVELMGGQQGRLAQRQAQQRDEAEASLNRAKDEYAAVERENAQALEKIAKNEDLKRQLQTEIALMKQQFEDDVTEVMREYEKVESDVRDYHLRLNAAYGHWTTTPSSSTAASTSSSATSANMTA